MRVSTLAGASGPPGLHEAPFVKILSVVQEPVGGIPAASKFTHVLFSLQYPQPTLSAHFTQSVIPSQGHFAGTSIFFAVAH